MFQPSTTILASFLPVFRSPTSNPSKLSTVTNTNDSALLIVKGRIPFPNGPTFFTTLWVLLSATCNKGEAISARYTCDPDGPYKVLWARRTTSILGAMISPVSQSTTFQKVFSRDRKST